MSGFIPTPILRVLRSEFGEKLTVTEDTADDEPESVFDSAEYKEFKKRASPADYIRTYRENAGLTQTELAATIGVTRAYICDIEHGRRAISKETAKKLSGVLGISIERLI